LVSFSVIKHQREMLLMSRYTFVYITAPNVKEAEKIGKILVEEKLAACVNIFPIRSIYRWKGKIEKAREVVLIAKTKKTLFSKLAKRVAEIHPYEIPCIVGFDIKQGNEEFLEWIDGETEDK